MSATNHSAFLRTFLVALASLVAIVVSVLFFAVSSPEDFTVKGEQLLREEVAGPVQTVDSVPQDRTTVQPGVPAGAAE